MESREVRRRRCSLGGGGEVSVVLLHGEITTSRWRRRRRGGKTLRIQQLWRRGCPFMELLLRDTPVPPNESKILTDKVRGNRF